MLNRGISSGGAVIYVSVHACDLPAAPDNSAEQPRRTRERGYGGVVKLRYPSMNTTLNLSPTGAVSFQAS